MLPQDAENPGEEEDSKLRLDYSRALQWCKPAKAHQQPEVGTVLGQGRGRQAGGESELHATLIKAAVKKVFMQT